MSRRWVRAQSQQQTVWKATWLRAWPAGARLLNWPRLAEARGRPPLDLALAGRAGGRIGTSLWAAVFHMGQPPRRAELVAGASLGNTDDKRSGIVTVAAFGLAPAVQPQQPPRRAAAVAACVQRLPQHGRRASELRGRALTHAKGRPACVGEVCTRGCRRM
eukprot:scaffold94385_cov59-Phaeocystis_antarctica.AAC.2